MTQLNQETGRGFTSSGVIAGSVSNTTTETTVFSQIIPAYSMGTNKILRFLHTGFITTPALLVPNITVRIYLGSTVLIAVNNSGLTAAQTSRPFKVQGMIANSAANSQQVYFEVTEPSGTLLVLTTSSGQSLAGAVWSVDTTVDQLFKVTVQFSAASATTLLTNSVALLELT